MDEYAVRQMLSKLVQGMLLTDGLPEQYKHELMEMASCFGVLPDPGQSYRDPMEQLFVIPLLTTGDTER